MFKRRLLLLTDIMYSKRDRSNLEIMHYEKSKILCSASYVLLLYIYHKITAGKHVRPLNTLLRPGIVLMEAFKAFQTVYCLIWTVVMRRTSCVEHLPNRETRRTKNILVNFRPTVVRFKICENCRHL